MNAATAENHLVIGATEAYERQNAEYTADEQAARANRYELAIHRLESASARQVCVQLMDALQDCSELIEQSMHVAVRRGDYAALGKLVFDELTKFRHVTAEAESE